jgi:hypothetical protein
MDHAVAMNNKGLQKRALKVVKYIGFGVLNKVMHLDLEPENFNEPNRSVVADLLDLIKMVGVKAYNLTTQRRIPPPDTFPHQWKEVPTAPKHSSIGVHRFCPSGRDSPPGIDPPSHWKSERRNAAPGGPTDH